jgi:hypothetical protein
MEAVLAHVRDATVLRTYDFVDVITEQGLGWQVKSTKESTPVTWKRAKIPNALELIEASRETADGLQALGNAIIDFCNIHAIESMETYNLTEIGYSRLVVHANMTVTYFERSLCSHESPNVFNSEDYSWQWSTPKITTKKEQLPALHGIHRQTGRKWWAWHGLGENQLHFSGEGNWWPRPEQDHQMSFRLANDDERLTIEEFVEMLSKVDN